ncbi:hypothetical protein BD324DRAFT_641191 [Kockovaella imperatae]|uniref:BZIP domain-containing protein n=1 Tax=Kockovaella imperatae TaxID=4999 RepID=A0A1Y1UL90_9TREE|nr:hypothetical protein BD324DRAFT_641191 [Kockovaella imperatae]ORX38810.1 hypothetical protein BD324DRAFT_641191 [Kockovaella imperatae]
MNQYHTFAKATSAPAEDFTIKQEPAPPAALVQAPAPAPGDFLGLPADQQLALQQLLDNLITYQNQFGVDMTDTAQAPVNNGSNAMTDMETLSGTVQPSMVFHSPVVTAPSVPSTSSATSSSVSPVNLKQSPAPSEDELIALDPLSPPVRKNRQASTGSMSEDLDAKIDSLVPLPTIFSAGRGKGGKKGGGLSSVVRGDDEEVDDDDSWRPSPEEYKKLSSKEKRQLRNKLSARAFRTRRKDYIGTLEAHIKDRDTVIDAIRSELVSSRVENQDLRRELEALKKSTMSILHPESASSSSASRAPAPLGMPESGPSRPRANATQPQPKFNTRKDLASTSLDTTKAFWGGNPDFFNSANSGSTICHTMLTPDFVLPKTEETTPLKSIHDLPRINLNPRLNETPEPLKRVSPARSPLPPALAKDDLNGTFAEWSESNHFNLRTMDSYRMQIWSRLAREAAAEKTSIPVDIRPKFYTESSSTAAAALAAHATNHVTSKLASSFWSAFTRPGSSKSLDTDKLAAVVTGRSKLAVVPSKDTDHTDDLVASLSGLKLQTGLNGSEGVGLRTRENPLTMISNFVFKLSNPMTGA